MRRRTRFVPALLFLFSVPVAAQQSKSKPPLGPSMGTRETSRLSVSGYVRDAQDHTALEAIQVELRALAGGTVARAFTSNGSFRFDNIGAGTYTLVVEQMGYEATSQQVDVVNGPVSGLSVELRRVREAGNVVAKGPSTVSARELSIPRNAHTDMEKGMVLLQEKSDYPGSVKQFERAIHEYPDYYEAYVQMGVAYMHLGNAANSEQALRKSLELSQEHDVDGLFWLATLFSNGERFADAEAPARKAVQLDPNSWQANSELARALLGLNRGAEAEKSAQAAVKLQAGNPLLYLLLANIHNQLQNDGALLEDLNNYLRLAPTGRFAEQARQQRTQVQQVLGDAQGKPATPAPPSP
jgi:Flp pilus assembly protein TadD